MITLTTDFGMRDHYVAAMKGVVYSLAPHVRVEDVCHEIRPHDVTHGAFVLRQIWPFFPVGTIHIAVVDPGVGSARGILIARYEGRLVIAPDNGLVTFLHRDLGVEALHMVENRRYFLPHISRTFHGRDIMAPVAAHLAMGVRLQEIGRQTDRLEILPTSHRAALEGNRLSGVGMFADRFGNIVTNVGADQIQDLVPRLGTPVVCVNGQEVGSLKSTFSDVPEGEPCALIGSADYLELVVNRGNAEARFGAAAKVRVDVVFPRG
jgi:S-adenosylmethionine hydrolase